MSKTEVIIEPGKQDVVITRVFDAPRDLVFQTMSDPDLIPKWWGPRSTTTEVDTMEPRTGGRWRFVHRSEGQEFGFHGVYHEVTPNERVVQTTEFELAPGHVALETMTLEDVDGKTRYVARALYDTVESRDAAVRAGMEGGMRETLDRLGELVER
ncbi:MAG TPA: SRPBCC family protein [Jiangellaceae bacterium]